MIRVVESLAFSNVWIAFAAGALSAASGCALGVGALVDASALATCGTFVVYSIDRLRDLERDRETAPRRSAFVARHKNGLRGATACVAVASLGLGALAGRALFVLVPVLVLGLLHRRLKRFECWKLLYITLAWTVVAVGLPALLGSAPSGVAPVAVIVAASLLANAIVSSLGDGEAAALRFRACAPRRLALAIAAVGCVAALLATSPVRWLFPIPLLTFLAVLGFRTDEAYGLVVVDGALLIGAFVTLAISAV